MLPRRLLLALLIVALTVLPPAGAQTKAPVVTTSTVYYRHKGTTDWSLFGYYVAESSARQVFDHLARSGYEAELRISNTPIPKVDPPPKTGLLPKSETISYSKAVEVFAWLIKQNDLAYRYPSDGCYARAHLMCERLSKQGFKPRKLWAVANGEELYARTRNHPRGYVTWGYHVAPMLRIRKDDSKQLWYVMDPSLFDRPVTIRTWMESQMRKPDGHRPFLTLTRPGEAPMWVDRKRKSGSGYWPGSDPRDGPTAHAMAVMKKYKQWEGRQPPRGAVRLVPSPVADWLPPPHRIAWLFPRRQPFVNAI